MGDKDSKLIFEGYKKEILFKEAAPAVALAAFPLVAPLLAILFAKTGWTREIMDFFKKYLKIDLDQFSESVGGALTRFFDPTGISSWVSLQKVQEAYDKDPNNWETEVEWWSQVIGTLPLWGKLIKGISTIFGGTKALQFLRKVFYYIAKDKGNRTLIKIGIKKWFEYYQKFKPSASLEKLHIEIIAQLLVNMYGREALNVVAELTDFPPIIQQKIKEVLDTKVPLIEEPTNEEEVKKELQQGAPVTQPSPTPAAAPTPYSISKDNDNEPVKGKDGSIIPIGGTFEVNGVTYIVTR